jgi:type II secretory pathway pseudopilin PulG
MLVVAIMGVILTIGIPSIFRAVRRSPMRQATSDLQEACQTARMLAILHGAPAEVIIRAQDGLVNVRRAPPERDSETGASPEPMQQPSGGQQLMAGETPRFTAHLPDSIAFKKLLVNLRDMMGEDEAQVRFYPNGTCDAFTATLFSEQSEERTITLEVTTGRDHLEIIR